jgi:predicted flap endonuclease-1-like 5' DNA nuclease
VVEPTPAPAPAPEVEPAPEAAPAPIEPTASGGADDLSRIKGLGPKLQALLPELGITTFAQIAAMTEADLAELDARLGPFAGRPARDGWVEQAGYLAAGDVAGFEARFGKV